MHNTKCKKTKNKKTMRTVFRVLPLYSCLSSFEKIYSRQVKSHYLVSSPKLRMNAKITIQLFKKLYFRIAHHISILITWFFTVIYV